VRLVLLEKQAQLVQLVLKVTWDLQVQLALLVRLVRLEQQVRQERLVLQVLKATKESKE
jgi:hypothetical protein